MKSRIILVIALTFVIATSCSYYKTYESISPIVGNELPDSAIMGETIAFKVSHAVFNGCGRFSRQETTIDGKTVTVIFYGKYPEAGICTHDIPIRETNYDFKAKEKGTYFFRFYQGDFGDEEFLLDTLNVQ